MNTNLSIRIFALNGKVVVQNIRRRLKQYVILFLVSLISTSFYGNISADLTQADLVPGSGDGLLVRDSNSGLEWLRLTETRGLSVVDVIDNGAGGYAEMGFTLASKEQVEAMFISGGIVELSTGFVEDNYLPATTLIDLFGLLQDTGGDLLTTQGWVQAPDLLDYVVHGVVQTASCCPPSGRAYVLDISALPKTTSSDVNGIFLMRPTITISVSIDIMPSKESNTINLRSRGGTVQVAVLTEGSIDALRVDPDTTKFGPSQVAAVRYQAKDVDRDGDVDLLLNYRIQHTGITCSDTEATLTGAFYDGTLIAGTDLVHPKNCQ